MAVTATVDVPGRGVASTARLFLRRSGGVQGAAVNFSLSYSVYRHSLSRAQVLAVSGEGRELSYGEFAKRAAAIAACLRLRTSWNRLDNQPPRVGVIASRSVDACLAVVATSWAGGSYVPIGLKLPEERILTILSLCKLSALITDAAGA